MSIKISRREFAGLSAVCIPSLWLKTGWAAAVATAAGSHQGASHINPIIGASTSQALGEGKISFLNAASEHPPTPVVPSSGGGCRRY